MFYLYQSLSKAAGQKSGTILSSLKKIQKNTNQSFLHSLIVRPLHNTHTNERPVASLKYFKRFLIAISGGLTCSGIVYASDYGHVNEVIESSPPQVTIYIWYSKNWKTEVGHVSLQTFPSDNNGPTAGIYASFWPTIGLSKYEAFLKKCSIKGMTSSLDDDISIEGRIPDETITLKTLKINAIHVAYEEFIAANYSYDLLASNLRRRGGGPFDEAINKNKIANCVLLIDFLLTRGGIDNISRRPPMRYAPLACPLLGLSVGIWTGLDFGLMANIGCNLIYDEIYFNRHTTILVKDIAGYVKAAKSVEIMWENSSQQSLAIKKTKSKM